MTNVIQHIGRGIAVTGSILVVAGLFIFPTRTFQELLGGQDLSSFSSATLLVALGLAVTGILLFRSVENTSAEEALSSNHQPPLADLITTSTSERMIGAVSMATSKPILILNIILATVVFVRASININSPLDVDENIHALSIVQHRISQELNPINTNPDLYTQNHVLPQLLSIISVKLFGVSKLAIRGPSIVLAALMLLSIFLLCQGLGDSIVATLLLIHFSTNQLVLWYMHSARGYMAMMLLTIVPFLIVLDFTKWPRPLSKGRLWLFGTCVFLAPFTHLFAMIFNGLLFFSFLLWLQNKTLDSKARGTSIGMIIIMIASAPLALFITAHSVLFLSRIGDFNASSVLNLEASLLGIMGMSLQWQGKLVIALVTVIALYMLLNSKKKPVSLPGVFSLVTVLFFILALTSLKTRVFESRFTLAFIAPILIWMGESISSVKTRHTKHALLLIALIVIGISPCLSDTALYQKLSYDLTDYDHFMALARKAASPVNKNCISFFGKDDLAIWAQDLYFQDSSNNLSSTTKCQERYYGFFPTSSPSQKTVELDLPINARELFKNEKGMILWQAK